MAARKKKPVKKKPVKKKAAKKKKGGYRTIGCMTDSECEGIDPY